MAEQIEKSWYTKYRPKTMEEYSGPRIKDIVLKRFTKRENMPHVIMVHGNRGCGKTTFARLISKYYLCTNFTEDGPCEECEMCTSINEILISGESSQVECPGVTELDATIMNGKEAIQDVLDDALQSPIYSDFKVLIIDECHMISAAGQNSMLKIIEDIPPHLVVVFATTNPEKVLQTIKSRCQLTLEVRKQSVADMSARLLYIAQREGLSISKEALDVISRKGNRVPRECINILEDIAKTYNGKVNIDNVREHLGGATAEMYLEYFRVSNKSLCDILVFIKGLKDNDVKLTQFVSGLMQFVMESMYVKHGIALEDYTPDYVKSIKELFDMYTSSDFDMLLQIIEYLSNNINSEDDSKNEVLLTTTAMRISKVNLLAKGLSGEQREAIIENKISLAEHSKMLKENGEKIEKVAEKMRIDLGIESLNDNFETVTLIPGLGDIMENVTIPEIKETQTVPDDREKNIKLGESVDSFFDD